MNGSGWKTIGLLMLFTDSLINSAPDDWKLVFKIDANGGNTNVYDIYMDRGITYNINDKIALNLTRRTGKHFKSDIINHWSDVDIEEVKVVVYHYGEEKAFLTFNGTGTDMTNWFSQKRMQNSSYSDLKHASQGEGYFFSIAGVSHPSRRFYVNKDWTSTQWCYDTGWLLVTAGSDGYCPFELGNTFSILYSPESTSITNRDMFQNGYRADNLGIFVKFKVSTCQPLRHSVEACSTPVQLAYNTYCYKLCDKSLTQTDLEEKVQKLEKELSVSRKDTNKFKRSITSAPDTRFSSKTIGLVGAVCIALVVGFIVAVDCINICQKCSKPNTVKAKNDDYKNDDNNKNKTVTTGL